MSSYGSLRVGPVVITQPRNRVWNELMAVFRDDMLQVEHVPARDYYVPENGYVASSDHGDSLIEVIKFRAAGRTIADRLDIMGVDTTATLAHLDRQFSDHSGIGYNLDFLASLSNDIKAKIIADRKLRASLTSCHQRPSFIRDHASSHRGSIARTSVVSDPPGCASYEGHWVADKPSMRVEMRVAARLATGMAWVELTARVKV